MVLGFKHKNYRKWKIRISYILKCMYSDAIIAIDSFHSISCKVAVINSRCFGALK